MASDIEAGTIKIHVHASEKIGFGPPTYSNVEIGASVTKIIPEGTDEEVLAALKELASGTVEAFVADEREAILEMTKTS